MENTNEERNVALNEEQKNNAILDQGIEQIQANGGMSEAAMEADIDSESLDSFFYDETEDNNDSPSENEIEAAERAYQEWEEMLDDNQIAEEIIEKNQRKEPANVDVKTNYVIDKLSKAGIEVVTDKEEFDRILESHSILQKMTADLSEFDKLAAKLEEEKKVTENIEKQKKSLEEKKEEIARTNYNELVDFINKTGKFIPAQDFDGFGYLKGFSTKFNLILDVLLLFFIFSMFTNCSNPFLFCKYSFISSISFAYTSILTLYIGINPTWSKWSRNLREIYPEPNNKILISFSFGFTVS